MVGRVLIYGAIGLSAFAYMVWPVSEPVRDVSPISGFGLIAHAGGGLPGATYSNSREAFEQSASQGFDLIEVDFETTESGELVLLHGWEDSYYRYFSSLPRLPKPLRGPWRERSGSAFEFTSTPMRGDLTPMSLGDLLLWLETHPGIRIVTDAKGDNALVLARLAERAGPEMQNRFIPQIYAPRELPTVKALGYTDIIFTAYKSELPVRSLLTFAEAEELFALTVPWQRVMEVPEGALESPVPVLAHTVNDVRLAEALSARGVDGLYTDFLVDDEAAFVRANSPDTAASR